MLSKYDEIRAKRARGDKGFTLIELLVVVVIMGILIAIAVPVYLNYQNNAKKKSLESDVRSTIAAVELCMSEHGGTFSTADCSDVAVHGDNNSVTIGEGTNGGYLITGSRSNPTWYVTYDSGQGGEVKGSETAGNGGGNGGGGEGGGEGGGD